MVRVVFPIILLKGPWNNVLIKQQALTTIPYLIVVLCDGSAQNPPKVVNVMDILIAFRLKEEFPFYRRLFTGNGSFPAVVHYFGDYQWMLPFLSPVM